MGDSIIIGLFKRIKECPNEKLGDCTVLSHPGCWGPDTDQVNHPSHYGGASNPYEAIKVIRAWNLGFSLGNTVKYISRAGKKDPKKLVEDLEKAAWYLNEEIEFLKKQS